MSGDSFLVSANIFRTVDHPAQGDVFMVSGNVQTSQQSNSLVFTYIQTEITDIIPDPAPLPGGVTILGVVLNKVKAVYIDDKKVSFRIISPTEIYAGLPLNVSSTTVNVYVEF